MFPPGLPGLALLLLRASVTLALLFQDHGHRDELSGWLHAAVILVALALSVGYFTPLFATMAVGFHLLIWFGHGVDSAALPIIFSLDALALALVGPGAYSVDSYRFGRRLIVLQPH